MFYQPNNNNFGFNNTQQIVRVHGEEGARMYGMQPNSSALLLDETDARVYLVQTDGAGYKTISGFNIEPIKAQPVVDMNKLLERIQRIEDLINESNISTNASE